MDLNLSDKCEVSFNIQKESLLLIGLLIGFDVKVVSKVLYV